MKTYQAQIIIVDERKNSRTITDTCEARNHVDAQRIFEARYPGSRVGAVRQV